MGYFVDVERFNSEEVIIYDHLDNCITLKHRDVKDIYERFVKINKFKRFIHKAKGNYILIVHRLNLKFKNLIKMKDKL